MNYLPKRRVQYVDIARGLAMICIVLGHLGVWEINKIVFTFHVPIFFLITGYFFNPEENWKTFLRKKSKTLLLPYWTTSILIALLAVFLDTFLYHGQSPLNTFNQWIYAALYGSGDGTPRLWNVIQIGALWFLLATFWGCLFLRIALLIPRKIRFIFILAVFYICYSTRSTWYPLSIQAGGTAVLFMYIGYVLRQIIIPFSDSNFEFRISFFILAILVWIWFTTTFQSFYLVHADIGRGAIDIAACLFVCYAVLTLSHFLDDKIKFFVKPLAFLGKYSLLVLCMHIIELNCIPWNLILEKLQMRGLPADMKLYVLIILKFIWIIPLTMLCAGIDSLRILFGLPEKKRRSI